MTRRVLEAVVLMVVYFAAGKLGLSLAVVNDSASAVWPPAGLAVGALMLLGPRVWPAVAIGAFLVNFTTSHLVGSSLLIAVGNTLEALAGWWLVTRFAGGDAVAPCLTDAVAVTGALGMGTDGAAGMAELRRAGAYCLVQDEASSAVFGMPRAALDLGAAEAAFPPAALGEAIARRAAEGR